MEKKKRVRPTVAQVRSLENRIAELQQEYERLVNRGFWKRVFNVIN